MADPMASASAGVVTMSPVFVVDIRHRADGDPVGATLRAAGLPAQGSGVGTLSPVAGGCWARLAPTRDLLVTQDRTLANQVIAGLQPGRHAAAMAVDVTEGYTVLMLPGPGADPLLAATGDEIAPFSGEGSARSHRVADVRVTVLRLDRSTCWLVVESSLAEHLAGRLREASTTMAQAFGFVAAGADGAPRVP